MAFKNLREVQEYAANQKTEQKPAPKIDPLTDEEIIKAGGHRNEAGGWCSPYHGNTCGYHHEFDRRR